ncbi:MAG: PDZ domain-containing protein [Planctomycetota bacterium]
MNKLTVISGLASLCVIVLAGVVVVTRGCAPSPSGPPWRVEAPALATPGVAPQPTPPLPAVTPALPAATRQPFADAGGAAAVAAPVPDPEPGEMMETAAPVPPGPEPSSEEEPAIPLQPPAETVEVAPDHWVLSVRDQERVRKEYDQVLVRETKVSTFFNRHVGRSELHLDEVATDGELARFGFCSGDVLVSIDGQPMESRAEIARYLEERPERSSFVVTIRRFGKLVRKRFTLP